MNWSCLGKRFYILVALIAAVCGGIWLFITLFEVEEMVSPSMEPSILGRGVPPTGHGDAVLIMKRIHLPLNKGDLVKVEIAVGGTNCTTIRRVAGVPGDLVPNPKQPDGTNKINEGFYYLLADSTNALDSRQLGVFSKRQIIGKVMRVFH